MQSCVCLIRIDDVDERLEEDEQTQDQRIQQILLSDNIDRFDYYIIYYVNYFKQ